MRQRTEAVAARVRPQARALGHELFKAAIRTGAAMPMATPMAVALAGAQALMQERRGAPSPPARSQKPPIPIKRASPAWAAPATPSPSAWEIIWGRDSPPPAGWSKGATS
ncbi:MAG: hypothetical protein ACKOD3_07660 [Phenylobacterium sp.]